MKKISFKNQPHFSHTMMWQYWLSKTKPKKSSDQPETLSIGCYRILKIFYLTEFSTDWLTAYLPTRPPASLMPSDSHNSTMAKAMGLIFFAIKHRFSLRGAFCHTAVHAMCSSWTYHGPPLCPFIFVHNEKCWLHMMASICYRNHLVLHSQTTFFL